MIFLSYLEGVRRLLKRCSEVFYRVWKWCIGYVNMVYRVLGGGLNSVWRWFKGFLEVVDRV
jgi:hypothetical protein